MKNITSCSAATFAFIVVAFFCMQNPVYSENSEQKKGDGASSATHQLHMLINHGLEMLMGANMVMLAEMKLPPGLDQAAGKHGRSMLVQGKKAIQTILNTPEMQAVHPGGKGGDPLMEYAHDLASAVMRVADMGGQAKLEDTSPDSMTLHHFNLLIAQALQMAMEGSNMMMIGSNGTPSSLEKESLENGKTMITNARTLIIEVMGSRAMNEMHGHEGGKIPAMGFTHKFAGAALEVLDLFDEMPR